MKNVVVALLTAGITAFGGIVWLNYPRKHVEVAIVAKCREIYGRKYDINRSTSKRMVMDEALACAALAGMKIDGTKLIEDLYPSGVDLILTEVSEVVVRVRQRFHPNDVGIAHELEKRNGEYHAKDLRKLCYEMVEDDVVSRHPFFSYLP